MLSRSCAFCGEQHVNRTKTQTRNPANRHRRAFFVQLKPLPPPQETINNNYTIKLWIFQHTYRIFYNYLNILQMNVNIVHHFIVIKCVSVWSYAVE